MGWGWASREWLVKKGNMKNTKSVLSPKLHRDGTVTYWSVYRQVWVRAGSVPDHELAEQGERDRARIQRHLANVRVSVKPE
jgi:hypothetical protein